MSKAQYPKRVVKVWHQLVGYIIQPRRMTPIICLLLGSGGNGKSKLVETVEKLLGSDAVYSGEVAQLESNRFGLGSLVGKLLFIDDDVRAGTQLPDGTLKKLSEQKRITAERKNRDHFDFILRALPVLLCNNPPSLADVSHGIQRRLVVFEFQRRFKGNEEDKTLFPSIWATELPGILNLALGGLLSSNQAFALNIGTAALRVQTASVVDCFSENRCSRQMVA